MRQTRHILVVCGFVAQALMAQQKPRVIASGKLLPLVTTLGAVTAAPATISFTATDPDLGSVAGSATSAVSWLTNGGSFLSTWTLTVQAASASFTNCATVPTSAITVSCSLVTGGFLGACRAAFPLSTVAQQVASGRESPFANAPFTVNINFTLADSWRYIAKQSPACTQTLTYLVTAP